MSVKVSESIEMKSPIKELLFGKKNRITIQDTQAYRLEWSLLCPQHKGNIESFIKTEKSMQVIMKGC